jgi:hypothetical protein
MKNVIDGHQKYFRKTLQSKPDKFRRDSAEDCWQVIIRQSKLVIDGNIRVCSEGKTRTKYTPKEKR